MSYGEISRLKSGDRIKKLLRIILEGKIIILQGRLKAEEEARLIEDTMAMIGHIKGFKGVELAVIGSKSGGMFSELKSSVAKFLVGDREAMTLIGPATVIKEIKKDPSKIELMLKDK